MGTVRIEGIPFAIEIEGDKPTKQEAERIKKIVGALQEGEFADTMFTKEKMEMVYATGDDKLIEAVEKSKELWEKQRGSNILKEFGFGEGVPEGLDLYFDRDDPFILGSVIGSIPGLKDMFKLKNLKLKNIPTKPSDIARAFGKTFFGGVFGSITGAAAYDIAQALVTGDKKYLPNWDQLNQDTREAIFWESIGLLLPEVVPKLASKTLDYSDPAIQQARKIANSLGIQLDIAAQSKIGQLVLKPIGILPLLGGGLRGSKGKRVSKLNDIMNDVLAKIAPTTSWTKQGVNIFQRGVDKFNRMKKVADTLWQNAYDAHAMLPDRNILNADEIFGAFKLFGEGNILREFKGITDAQGIIRSFDDLVKSGWFRENNIERLAGNAAVKDMFNWMRKSQKEIIKQGGDISYEQFKNWNGKLNSLYNDIVNQGTQMNKEFAKVLVNFKTALDTAVSTEKINLSKINDPLIADSIINAHKTANTFTKGFKSLFETPAAGSFNVFVKNIFDTGIDLTKKDIDMMLDNILKIKSPQTLRDMKKIVGEKVFKDIAKEFVNNAFQKSKGMFDITGSGSVSAADKKRMLQFDPLKLAKELGFNIRSLDEKGKFLLKEAGIDPQFLRNLIDYGAFEAGVKIGDPSSYLMRSAQIKGLQPFIRGILGGGAGTATSFGLLGPGTALGGLLGTLIFRYGLTKVLGNPNLAKAANLAFDPARQTKITNVPFTKLPLGPRFWQRVFQDVFDLHLRENPGEENVNEAYKSLIDIKETFDPDSVQFRMFDEIINDLGIGPIEPEATIMDQNIQLKERILSPDADEIIGKTEEEVVPIQIPQVNESFEMANVVEPIDSPVSTSSADPTTIERLESVGLPLFSKHGGIASLLEHPKPRQMVA
jgi:hypothetical protein